MPPSGEVYQCIQFTEFVVEVLNVLEIVGTGREKA